MRGGKRNVAPALVTTIVVFLVTLPGLFFAYRPKKDSEHRKTGDDPEPRAFALGYYLAACVNVEGQNMANTLSNQSVRLASALRIPEQAFPGSPNNRLQDKCHELNTVGRIGDHLV